MKLILDAEDFRYGTFEKDGKSKPWARLTGRDTRGRYAQAVVFDNLADALNSDLANLTGPGEEIGDKHFIVEMTGEWRDGKQRLDSSGKPLFNADGSPKRSRSFHVETYAVLTGPALELARARKLAVDALAQATEANAKGDRDEAYAALWEFVARVARRPADNADEDMTAQAEAAPGASTPAAEATPEASAPVADTAPAADAASGETASVSEASADQAAQTAPAEGDDTSLVEAPVVETADQAQDPAAETSAAAEVPATEAAPAETAVPVTVETKAAEKVEEAVKPTAAKPAGGIARPGFGKPGLRPAAQTQAKPAAAPAAAAPPASASPAPQNDPEAAAAAHFARKDGGESRDILDDELPRANANRPAAPTPAVTAARPAPRPVPKLGMGSRMAVAGPRR